jgi:uncharacterized membrane protein
MPFIFGVIGAAIGASFGDIAAPVLGFAIGFVAAKLRRTTNDGERMEQQLAELRQRVDGLEREVGKAARQAAAAVPTARPDVAAPPSAAPPPIIPAPSRPEPTPIAPRPERAPIAPPLPPVEPVEPVAAREPRAPAPPEPPPMQPAPAGAGASWLIEFFTTGNVVAKAGMVIVFFGVAFLVRYAADRGLLPIEFRLMSVAAGAMVMLAIGWRLRRSRRDYAMVLQGGAVGLLYLTIFAAFRLYGLLPGPLTFALLVTVVVFSGVLAVLQDAIVLAVLGASGGFLAPILASTGGGSHVALFSYYAVLNGGVVGIAWFRAWRFLNWLAFVFTFGIGFLWGQEFYQPALFATTEPFLVLFFLLFLAVAVLFAQRQPPQLRGYIDGTLVFGAPAVAFSMQSVLVRDIPFGRAYSAVVLSALYLALTRSLWRRDQALRPLAEAFLALGVVFLILAVPLAFEGHATAAAWALEGTGLVWIGVRQHRLLARLSGAALIIAAGMAFAVMDVTSTSTLPVLNTRFLAGAAIAAGAIVGGRLLARARDTILELEFVLEWTLLVWGLLWWFGAVAFEIDRHVTPPFGFAAQLLAFALSTALIALLARLWQWRAMMLATLPMGPLMWVTVLPLFALQPSIGPHQDLGWIAWPVAIGVSYLLMFWYEKFWPPVAVKSWHAGATWLTVFLVTWTLAVVVRRMVPDADTWSSTIWCVVPSLFVLGLRTFGRSLTWPVQRFERFYTTVIPLAPIAGILVWVAWASSQSGAPDPLPYVPIVNPIELVQVLGLIAAFVGSSPSGPVSDEIQAFRRAGLALLTFLAANVIVARVVHFYWQVPFELDSLVRSGVFQTGISILWGVTAGILMTLARVQLNRMVWMTGAGLLAVLIVKLFLVDLGNVGGIARIVSFLATGVLILVIGYFAPVPPRTERTA